MPHWESVARRHVAVLLKYLKAHAVSVDVLAADPTRRDRLLQEVVNSNEPGILLELKHRPEYSTDYLLSVWDAALEKEPTCFEDHFRRANNAASALSYYERDKVGPDMAKYGKRFDNFLEDMLDEQFSEFMATLLGPEAIPRKIQAPAQAPAPPRDSEGPNLSLQSVKGLLQQSALLFSTKFYHRAEEDDLSGLWSVKKINRTETANGMSVQYGVVFDDDTAFDLEQDDLIDIMLKSCVVVPE